MSIRVEIYTATGVVIGQIEGSGRLREGLEAGRTVALTSAAWHPIDGTGQTSGVPVDLAVDEIQIAAGDEMDELPIHAQWHDVVLDVGPFVVAGQMPTMPGFDPGRALARPTGQFVQLRDATIALATDTDPGLRRPGVLVNRYVVDRVRADLMLGFFFPGAEMVAANGGEPIAAPVAAQPSTATAAVETTAPVAADGPAAAAAPAAGVAATIATRTSTVPTAGSGPAGPATDPGRAADILFPSRTATIPFVVTPPGR